MSASLRKMAGVTSESSAVVNGLGTFYQPDGIERKTDLESRHITAEMSIVARASWTIQKWGITRNILGVTGADEGAIKQFDYRRLSLKRESRKEMETVLSAEQRKEVQNKLDPWLGALKR